MAKRIMWLVAILIFPCIAFADYSDVLLVSNNLSGDSLAIADYFAANRPNLTHRLNVSMPSWWTMNFSSINSTLLQPIRAYLNSSDGSGINYIVLTKDIPTVTNQTGCCPNQGASVDSVVALLNTQYESQIAGTLGYQSPFGAPVSVENPYYRLSSSYSSICGSKNFCPFSRSVFGVYLVTRLDGFNLSDVYGMIDRSASTAINRTARNQGTAMMTNAAGYFTNEIQHANTTLSDAGLLTMLNSSYPPEPTFPLVNYSNISYIDFYQKNSFSPNGLPNFTFINGSLASPRYSFAGRYTNSSSRGTIESLASELVSQGATAVYSCSREPYSTGSNKPDVLAKNFIHGTYYADIIWNAVPKLSHSAVVFADPKAGPIAVHINISAARLLPPSQNFSCAFRIYDNVRTSFNVTYGWYKNGVLQPEFSGEIQNALPEAELQTTTVPAQNVSTGEQWSCNISLSSGGESLGSFSKSAYVVSEFISECGQPLDVPGTTYFLVNNLTAYPSVLSSLDEMCINISAQNITIDCNGYTIKGGNNSNTYGIYSNQFNTTVENCIVEGVDYGIMYYRATNGLINNTVASASVLSQASNNIISNYTSSAPNLGISINGGANNTIIDSNISNTYAGDCFQGAVNIIASSNNTISNSFVTSITCYGVDLEDEAEYNAIINTEVFSASNYGVHIVASNHNSLINATGISNSSIGIRFHYSNNNNITSSTGTSESDAGLVISEYSNNNKMTQCRFNSSTNTAIRISGSENLFLENNITAPVWVENGAEGNIFNDSSRGNIYYLANGTPSWKVFDIRDTDGRGWADAGDAIPFSSATVGAYWTGFGSDHRPYVPAAVFGNESNISSTYPQIQVIIGNDTNATGKYIEGNHTVNITSNGSTIISFSFNFSAAALNFSNISITNGTSGGKSYAEISGINSSAIIGGKTIYLYNASADYNYVCLKDEEGASATSITSGCSGSNETLVPCSGTKAGYTCTRNGTTLVVTGLNHSALIQSQPAAPLSGGSSSYIIPSLSYSFNCTSGALEVSAKDANGPIKGLEVRLYKSGTIEFTAAKSNSSGKAAFTIAESRKYYLQSVQDGTYLPAEISAFELKLCLSQPSQIPQSNTLNATNQSFSSQPGNQSVPAQNNSGQPAGTQVTPPSNQQPEEQQPSEAGQGKTLSGLRELMGSQKSAQQVLLPAASLLLFGGAIALIAIGLAAYLVIFRKKK